LLSPNKVGSLSLTNSRILLFILPLVGSSSPSCIHIYSKRSKYCIHSILQSKMVKMVYSVFKYLRSVDLKLSLSNHHKRRNLNRSICHTPFLTGYFSLLLVFKGSAIEGVEQMNYAQYNQGMRQNQKFYKNPQGSYGQVAPRKQPEDTSEI